MATITAPANPARQQTLARIRIYLRCLGITREQVLEDVLSRIQAHDLSESELCSCALDQLFNLRAEQQTHSPCHCAVPPENPAEMPTQSLGGLPSMMRPRLPQRLFASLHAGRSSAVHRTSQE